ncbi:hypothetical protein FB45DRAFT_75596 [Roridomyces roridus]|uniref:Uncharacterized protein n=1 Tax=Roridomyces roridus TaxID=1738132 RepID=A0AAD7BNJ1_9AGAR|nr:hypothetical protein FB45DRAFT_75596 [Roridomyces roridus]
MAQFLMPVNRPSFQSLMPVYTVESKSRLEFFAHDLRTPRPSMHFPMRTHWCGPEEVHALVYNPTHEYWPDVQKCVTPTTLAMQVGVPFDLFVNRRNAVCYAGVYALHSMREVGQFGEPIPPDVSPMAIAHAAGATGPFASKIIECFPDGQIRVECFGLQCLGFDEQLYYALVQREQSRLQSQSQSQAAAPGEEPKTRGSLKRPAESQGGRVG